MQDIVNPSIDSSQKRAYALDALRGLAILAMTFSGLIPFGVLPAWMYHSQEPPPTHAYSASLSGLTWVDVVFPVFLFSMGAAIPLALSRRITQGWNISEILLSIFKRGFLLGSFAIFVQHIRPHRINPKLDTQTWLIALLGFILLFFMFVRLPKFLNTTISRVITFSAWVGAILLLTFLRYPDGSGFSINRSDIIIVLLTNAAVFGSILWYFTKDNLLLRLGCLGLLMALRLSASTEGWIASVWSFSPAPWIFKFEYLSYLFLIVPGTIAGDLILAWMRNEVEEFDLQKEQVKLSQGWNTNHVLAIVISAITICLILLIGLQARLVFITTLSCALLLLCGWYLCKNPVTTTEHLINKLYKWGVYWLILGLLFEPYEGGIKKDPPSMSYYFICASIAILLLIAFTLIIDVLKQQKWLQLLIDSGQNPMIGYVGVANLIWPVLGITGLYQWISENTKATELGILRAIIYTLLLAFIVSFFTKRKLFLRT